MNLDFLQLDLRDRIGIYADWALQIRTLIFFLRSNSIDCQFDGKLFLTTANMSNMPRGIFFRRSIHRRFSVIDSKNVALGHFLRLDLPRACLVYEGSQMTIDVPLRRLMCQVHQLTLLDTTTRHLAFKMQALIDKDRSSSSRCSLEFMSHRLCTRAHARICFTKG